MGRFKVNEQVMAKWPGSNLWFEGTIVDLNDIEYQIRFNDEGNSEYVVKYKDVKPIREFTRKRSKSRGRSRSRGRLSAKSQSPARKPRSPGRPAKKEVEMLIEKSVSVKTMVTSVEPEVVTLDDDLSLAKTQPRSIRADLFAPRTSTPTRQSPRLFSKDKNDLDGQMNNVKANTTDLKAVAKTSSAGIGSKLGALISTVGAGVKKIVCALVPSLATIKALISMAILLVMPFLLNETCTKKRCTLEELPPIPKPVAYYDLKAIAIVGGYLASQLLLYFLPFGRLLKTHSGGTVRRNGWLAVVVSVSTILALHYMNYDLGYVYGKYRQLLATTMALGILLSLVAYILAAYTPKDAKNPHGNTGHILPDFFNGRDLSPSIGRLDLKFFAFRAGCIAWILINEIIAIKDIRDLKVPDGKYNITLFVACALQILYAADWMLFEDTYLTTYEYSRQGFGLFVLLSNFSMVFTLPIFTRLILNYRNDMEWYYLALIVALNLLGYTITRAANSQKHAFRTNPSDPALAHLESIPTAAGTRLLVSGWWGFVRHPNYLGDILVFTSWALLCGFRFALPWLMVGLDVLFLVGRTFEVERACKKKYGTLWESYTSRVRNRLIPKIF